MFNWCHIITNTNWTVNKSTEDHAGLRSDYIYHFIPGTFMVSATKMELERLLL